ncbi:MAG TPA: SGNH/GDSL hydrolase family protein [Polyangiaceae bacterium]
MTNGVAQQIRQVAARHPERKADRFGKVGDSITRSAKFLRCLADADADPMDAELRTTIAALRAASFDSFRRESACAENGWSSWQPLAGKQPPLFRELAEVQGLFTFVLLGTNDIETSRVTTFARRFVKLIDASLAHGSVPLISTIPERRDRELSRLKVPRFNAAIRAIAQARRVPLVDLHHALARLPNEGLSSDGIHPSVLSVAGRARACDFGPEGLRHGFNVRNWLSLQALARARGVFEAGWEAERATTPAPSEVEGRVRVAELPLVEVRALTAERPGAQGCSRAVDGGVPAATPALSYDVSLTRSTFLEVLALASETADSLAIELTPVEQPARCVATGSGFTRTLLGPGDYSVTVRGKAATAMVGLLLGRSGAS